MQHPSIIISPTVTMRFGSKKIPKLFYIFTLAYLSYCLLFTPNFLISIPVALFPLFAFKLFWIDKQPNVLFWGMMMQWLYASMQLLYANLLQVTLEERLEDGVFPAKRMDDATLLSVIGLYFFGLGLFLAIRKLKILDIREVLDYYSPRKIFMLYVIASVIIYFTAPLIWFFPSIVQYVYFFFYIKWGFFIIAFYVVHKRARHFRKYLYGFIALEIVLSFSSFFAGGFINIATYTFVAVLLLQPKLTFRSYLFITAGAVVLFHFMILWTAIKGEYRSFVSKGKRVQAVLVSREESNAKFVELISNVSGKQYEEAIVRLVDRIGYIQFFGAALDYVPDKKPFQQGQIYLSAVQHYLVPRFINPNKAVLDDSKHTSEFTGIKVSGMSEASSFSLGYVADAYIDFGPFYMFLVLFAFGYLFGIFYKYLARKSPNELWVWILTGPFFLLVNIYGTDTKKALGWILIYFLTVAVLRKQLIKRIDPFIRLK